MKKNIHIKEKELKKLTERIRGCRKCNLYKTRKNSVSGVGWVFAKIMVLGQAPGFEEDKTECFPPKNRKPKKEEIEACLSFLKKQIEIINPGKLILLGEVAFLVFFLKERLSNFRGRWAKLRFPKMKEILEEDFRKLKLLGCIN